VEENATMAGLPNEALDEGMPARIVVGLTGLTLLGLGGAFLLGVSFGLDQDEGSSWFG
jgi:hypothetical protein